MTDSQLCESCRKREGVVQGGVDWLCEKCDRNMKKAAALFAVAVLFLLVAFVEELVTR